MLVIRCTLKAFKKLGCKPRAIEVSHPAPTLGDWYVNTIDYLNGGDLMLACMHTESLYVLMTPLQPDMDGPSFACAFLETLLTRLIELDIPPNTVRKILGAYGDSAIFAKSTDRSVAGHLNSALQDLDFLLDIPTLHLTEGNRLIVPRIEHRLNDTPRGCSSKIKKPVWPLEAFWRCLRRLCPELPPRTTLNLTPIRQPHLARVERTLHDHLPPHLAGKIYDALREMDVLFSADELRTLAKCFESQTIPVSGLSTKLAEDLCHQTSFGLERLGDEDTP